MLKRPKPVFRRDRGPQVRYLGDLQRLDLRPGDVVVMTSEEHISDEIASRLRIDWERYVPGVKCIVLGGGLRLGVLGAQRAERLPC